MHWRVSLSRLLGRMIFGRDEMLSSIADQRQLRAARWIDLANAWRHPRHCQMCSDWEALRAREADTMAEWRRAGLL